MPAVFAAVSALGGAWLYGQQYVTDAAVNVLVALGTTEVQVMMVSDLHIARPLTALADVDSNEDIDEFPEVGESDPYLQRTTRTTRPLMLMVEPEWDKGSVDQGTCDEQLFGERKVGAFRIRVGGENPTRIPYIRTSLVGASRNTEEATATVTVDRTGTPVRMYLLDAEIEPEE